MYSLVKEAKIHVHIQVIRNNPFTVHDVRILVNFLFFIHVKYVPLSLFPSPLSSLSSSPLSLSRFQQLQFRPPLEEIRAKYYRDMKKFICIPLHFRGVGIDSSSSSTTIFPRVIDRNAPSFSTVYTKAEGLFSRLQKSVVQFEKWVVLGSRDLDALVDRHCRTTADFEKNFRSLKGRGRDAEKLPK